MRLQVHVLPAHAGPDTPALSSFLEIAPPAIGLEQLSLNICTRHDRLYPNKRPLSIHKLQDNDGNDLDLTYTVGDIFTDKSENRNDSVVRIIQASDLRGSSIPPESGLRSRSWRERTPAVWNQRRFAHPNVPEVHYGPGKRQRTCGSPIEEEPARGADRWGNGYLTDEEEGERAPSRFPPSPVLNGERGGYSPELGEATGVPLPASREASRTSDLQMTGSGKARYALHGETVIKDEEIQEPPPVMPAPTALNGVSPSASRRREHMTASASMNGRSPSVSRHQEHEFIPPSAQPPRGTKKGKKTSIFNAPSSPDDEAAAVSRQLAHEATASPDASRRREEEEAREKEEAVKREAREKTAKAAEKRDRARKEKEAAAQKEQEEKQKELERQIAEQEKARVAKEREEQERGKKEIEEEERVAEKKRQDEEAEKMRRQEQAEKANELEEQWARAEKEKEKQNESTADEESSSDEAEAEVQQPATQPTPTPAPKHARSNTTKGREEMAQKKKRKVREEKAEKRNSSEEQATKPSEPEPSSAQAKKSSPLPSSAQTATSQPPKKPAAPKKTAEERKKAQAEAAAEKQRKAKEKEEEKARKARDREEEKARKEAEKQRAKEERERKGREKKEQAAVAKKQAAAKAKENAAAVKSKSPETTETHGKKRARQSDGAQDEEQVKRAKTVKDTPESVPRAASTAPNTSVKRTTTKKRDAEARIIPPPVTITPIPPPQVKTGLKSKKRVSNDEDAEMPEADEDVAGKDAAVNDKAIVPKELPTPATTSAEASESEDEDEDDVPKTKAPRAAAPKPASDYDSDSSDKPLKPKSKKSKPKRKDSTASSEASSSSGEEDPSPKHALITTPAKKPLQRTTISSSTKPASPKATKFKSLTEMESGAKWEVQDPHAKTAAAQEKKKKVEESDDDESSSSSSDSSSDGDGDGDSSSEDEAVTKKKRKSGFGFSMSQR